MIFGLSKWDALGKRAMESAEQAKREQEREKKWRRCMAEHKPKRIYASGSAESRTECKTGQKTLA
jgi:hypothetical protein